MAEISLATRVDLKGHCFLHQWLLVTTGDTGQELEYPGAADKTLTVDGTFSGGTVALLQGSNDGTNWFTCTNPQGSAISFTAAGMMTVMEDPRFLRPSVSTGSSDSINYRLVSRSTQN